MSNATPAGTPGSTVAKAPAAPPVGASVASQLWNSVNQPGSYVCNDTGRLLRVPASGLKDGITPLIEFVGPQGPSKVTRLSPDPLLPIADLRTMATAASIKPQF
ncbi:MAG TPA: hypothetical protein VFS92_10875 [Planctomycetota bacterium]|nr:hypothetical protein [Planctomycetota bacterium]